MLCKCPPLLKREPNQKKGERGGGGPSSVSHHYSRSWLKKMVTTKNMKFSLHCFSKTNFWRLFPCDLYLFICCRSHRTIPRNQIQKGGWHIHFSARHGLLGPRRRCSRVDSAACRPRTRRARLVTIISQPTQPSSRMHTACKNATVLEVIEK